ncbi:MAG: hypothetical protein ACRYFY_13900 [Janthinobacterium lividum]
MNRTRPLLILGTGLVLLLALLVLGLAGVRVMPSYLSAWLFVMSVPLGALLLVSGLEALGIQAMVPVPASDPMSDHAPGLATLLPPLQALLPLLPVVAVCGLPILLLAPTLYDPTAWPAEGIGRGWFARGPFSVRMVVFLAAWSALALLFSVPARSGGRRGVAGITFAIVLVTGTLAAFDWTMAVQPAIASSSFGLLVLAGGMVSALAVACVLPAPATGPRVFAIPLLLMLAIWIFLHFSQFLVIWSANKPDEATWYLQRIGGFGAVCLWFATLMFVLALVLLLPNHETWHRPVAIVAGLALLVRLLESFWFITPAFRGSFTLSIVDVLAVCGLVAVIVGVRAGGWWPAGRGHRHVRT